MSESMFSYNPFHFMHFMIKYNHSQTRKESAMFRKKNTGGYVLKLSPQGPKMRFKSEKEANEYLAKLKEKNAKYRSTENN